MLFIEYIQTCKEKLKQLELKYIEIFSNLNTEKKLWEQFGNFIRSHRSHLKGPGDFAKLYNSFTKPQKEMINYEELMCKTNVSKALNERLNEVRGFKSEAKSHVDG